VKGLQSVCEPCCLGVWKLELGSWVRKLELVGSTKTGVGPGGVGAGELVSRVVEIGAGGRRRNRRWTGGLVAV
jgi:hypothetical protein